MANRKQPRCLIMEGTIPEGADPDDFEDGSWMLLPEDEQQEVRNFLEAERGRRRRDPVAAQEYRERMAARSRAARAYRERASVSEDALPPTSDDDRKQFERSVSVSQSGKVGDSWLSSIAVEPPAMSLSQAQIIRSLAEALAWFERELSWHVKPSSLPHLTGRIGELYTAMLTRGQMALGVAQPGYDVVSAEGQRISVKTITTSIHADFNKSTIHLADCVVIIRINVVEGEASIEELFHGNIEELKQCCNQTATKLIYMIKKSPSVPVALDGLAITGSAKIGIRRIIQYENSSIVVETDGKRDAVAYPILLEIAADIGVSPLNSNQNKMNTRQLGAAIIAARSSISHPVWDDSSLTEHDEDEEAP